MLETTPNHNPHHTKKMNAVKHDELQQDIMESWKDGTTRERIPIITTINATTLQDMKNEIAGLKYLAQDLQEQIQDLLLVVRDLNTLNTLGKTKRLADLAHKTIHTYPKAK